ncbi:MAG: xanthine dehydrogenase family protein molybdopterin-binding subunit [Planctomycetales bacterium]|nr:xanthine dehydrogenase family protein molybdopterin-binding subunit [Planctomycetales bacterium]
MSEFENENIEVERYELRQPGMYQFVPDRRLFVQSCGATGMLIAVMMGSRDARAQQRRTARRDEILSERFHLGADGIVTVFTSKVEVGQGSRTQLTQAAAEELHLDPKWIRLVMADTTLCPDDGGTAGSRTTPSTVPRIRNAAAALYNALTEHVANRWHVAVDDVQFQEGVFLASQNQRLSLAELSVDHEAAEVLSAAPPSNVAVLPHEKWRYLGTSLAKVGSADVVTGQAVYPTDVQLPGMWYAKVLRPKAYGAQLISIDLNSVSHDDTAAVVREGDFIACAAPTTYDAAQALRKIQTTAKWKQSDHPASKDLFAYLKRTAQNQPVFDHQSQAEQRLECEYTVAYVQHAPMEPRAAVANWEDNLLTVWTGSQQPARVQSELCDAFRLPPENVRVIIPDTGGGFGGKHTGEVAVEAAKISKLVKRPIKLRWTREEEFTWAYFRPAGLIEVRAGLTNSALSYWHFVNYNSGGSAIESPYRCSSAKSQFVQTSTPLRQGSYRALASTANTFARESAMDELAFMANLDPLEFRTNHLEDGRLKDVLLAAAEKFGWAQKRGRPSANRGIGLACGTEKGSFVAACVEVEIQEDAIKVLHVCQAYECGAIQNPRNLQSQVEGSIMMGLGAAMREQMEFENGQILTDNFSSYLVPRMKDLPEMDILLLDRPDLPSVGGSETPIIAIAPAIANAVFAATGYRSRSMPLRVKA